MEFEVPQAGTDPISDIRRLAKPKRGCPFSRSTAGENERTVGYGGEVPFAR
jgi:hypothetical protein